MVSVLLFVGWSREISHNSPPGVRSHRQIAVSPAGGAATMGTAPRHLTRADLVDLTCERTGVSREESRKVVETILQIIEDRLQTGEKVKISGFGTFTVKHKHSRRGRNPKTGVPISIDSRRVVSFKASQLLKARVDDRSSGLFRVRHIGIRSSLRE
jgi:integration host factor subunit alpha